MLNVSEIQVGDIFSEASHYTLVEIQGDKFRMKHHESGKVIQLDNKYVIELLSTADHYEKEIVVGKEDKLWTQKQIDDLAKRPSGATANPTPLPKVGDLRLKGIRTIWDEIHSSQVFTVCFTKQDKPLSAKKFQELKDAQILDALERIQKVKDAKKGVANEASKVLKEIQENPVLPYEKGEERILRGYKIQFSSLDGRYDCIDMEYPDGADKPNIRPVNINTLQWIVFQGVKYILE